MDFNELRMERHAPQGCTYNGARHGDHLVDHRCGAFFVVVDDRRAPLANLVADVIERCRSLFLPSGYNFSSTRLNQKSVSVLNLKGGRS